MLCEIRHIGLSQISIDEYEKAKKTAAIVSVQSLYNVEDRSSEDVLETCERDGTVFLPWFPLGGTGSPKHAALKRMATARGAKPTQGHWHGC
jgi:pyridoxine 4-dehydrogenase